MSKSSFSGNDRYTLAVLAGAAVFFSLAAWNLVDGYAIQPKRTQRKKNKLSQVIPSSKTTAESAVSRMTYMTRPDDCEPLEIALGDARPRLHAGALFKLIDIAAGVAARRHAQASCVTISVDSVVLLKPIFLGELLNVSASVNRAWGRSMEVGVRIVKEGQAEDDAKMEYISHSYLSFVAIDRERTSKDLTLFNRAWNWFSFGVASPTSSPPIQLSSIKTTTRLESRRHLLAGRRRQKRLEDANSGKTKEGVEVEVKKRVIKEMQQLIHDSAMQSSKGPLQDEQTLRAIELEVLIQSWSKGEDVVVVRNGLVEVALPGDDPLSFSESEVRLRAKQLGIKLPGDEAFQFQKEGKATAKSIEKKGPWPSISIPPRSIDSTAAATTSSSLSVAETLTTSMHLVFPQHTNSHGIIFGGNTMAWSEEVALMACRKIRIGNAKQSNIRWRTVSMDGLTFNVQVGVGEVMIFSAVVVQTFRHSCEVYVIAEAEDRQGKKRFTNDVMFTMAFNDDDGDASSKSISTRIKMPRGSAMETFAQASTIRRMQRLELRQMLLRVYSNGEKVATTT